MIELEKTYLAKYLPENLKNSEFKELIDIYIPENVEHPDLRIRKLGDKYEMTKKQPLKDGDYSQQKEQTIILTPDEFEILGNLPGKKLRKIRYYYDHQGQTAEIDVFQDDLQGLVLIDFEFKDVADMNNFIIPEFCLAEVTQDRFLAGGMLCGKKYDDVKDKLAKFAYKKL